MNKTGLLLLALFAILNPVISKSQSAVITHQESIVDIYFDDSGRLNILSEDNSLCNYEGYDVIDNCLTLDFKADKILRISKNHFILLAKNLTFTYLNDELIQVDTLDGIVTSALMQEESVYVGTTAGLYNYDNTAKQISLISNKGSFINDLSPIDNSRIAIALDNGIIIRNTINNKERKIELSEIVLSLSTSINGKLVAATNNQELLFFDPDFALVQKMQFENGTIIQLEYSLSTLFILSKQGVFSLNENLDLKHLLIGDFDKLLALNTNLFLVKGGNLINYDLTINAHSMSQPIFSIDIDDTNDYWLGSDNYLYQYKFDSLVSEIKLPTEKSSLFVSAIHVNDDYIFAGTMGNGLYIYSKSGQYIKRIYSEDFDDRNNIIQIKQKDNLIWIAYLNGVIVIDAVSHGNLRSYDNIVGKNYLYCIEPLSLDEFYLGTSSNGVVYYKNGTPTILLEDESIHCLSLSEDVLYVGTEKSGLYKITETHQEKLFDKKNIYSILPLDSIILINTVSDSYLYNLNNQITLPLYTDNLKESILNGVSHNFTYVMQVYENGVLQIDKHRISKLFESSLTLHQPIQYNKQLRLKKNNFEHDENSISFTYHLDSYYQNQNIFYKYRLKGLDSTWQITQQNRIDYFNLNPRNYKFEVSHGYEKEFSPREIKSFSFKIKKAFWNTTWFRILGLLLSMIMAYLFIRRRERDLLYYQKLEKERIKSELSQLKKQIDPHFLFNSFNSLIGLIEEDPSSAIKATEKLSSLYRLILTNQEKDTITIEDELEIASTYFQMHKLRFEENIKLDINLNGKIEGRIIPLSLLFLIENAIKHNAIGKTYPLIIKIDLLDNYIRIVNNKNQKFSTSDKSGYGINNLRSRYSLFSSLPIKIENYEKQFCVKLPILND